MQPTRRFLLTAAGALLAAPALQQTALAQGAPPPATDPRMADRADGPATAKTVEEWFSFTCPHCARFAADVFPQIRAQLIDTGKLRYVFREYPRDQVDLMAACVARSLPPARYEPFVMTLLATQMRWAFDRNVEPKEELAKMAALAGMPRAMFDQAISDDTLKQAILAAQANAEKSYNIESTPTFVFDGKAHSGEMTFDAFSKMVTA